MLSKKTIYAIELCVLLAGQRSGACVTTRALSDRLCLSVSYLENILKLLKAGNMVDAEKGPGGGYFLVGRPDHITIDQVVSVLEGAPSLDDAPSYEAGLTAVVKNTLSGFTLADFADHSWRSAKAAEVELGTFKFKPLPAPFMPKAPNSVFQLHMTF